MSIVQKLAKSGLVAMIRYVLDYLDEPPTDEEVILGIQELLNTQRPKDQKIREDGRTGIETHRALNRLFPLRATQA